LTNRKPVLDRQTTAYVAPFVAFIAMLVLNSFVPTPAWVRLVVSLAAIVIFSRGVLAEGRLTRPLLSVLIGVAVFVVWVAPDFLMPGYHDLPIFSNSLVGHAVSTLLPRQKSDHWPLLFRALVSVVAVPILEELFWRGWLMRWLIDRPFWRVPLGAYRPGAFWIVALLFASEHGPYWDVGLAAGIIYNWWMLRTRSLWDCILAHAVTNGLLAAWVITRGEWQYWL
jgi:uncharacterized protein